MVTANNTSGIVRIGNKDYKTVGLRVTEFRADYPIKDGWAIRTEAKECTEDSVLFLASIIDPHDRVVATGHAHETWESQINRTSAVENCETSAIGRALANAGLGGSEFASADEVQRAIHQQKLGKTNRPAAQTKVEPPPRTAVNFEPPKDWPDTEIHDIKAWVETLSTATHFKAALEMFKGEAALVGITTDWEPVLMHFKDTYKAKYNAVGTPDLNKRIKDALDKLELDKSSHELLDPTAAGAT